MGSVWDVLTTYLEDSAKLNVPLQFILLTNHGAISLFTIAKEFTQNDNRIYAFYTDYNNHDKIDHQTLTALEIAISWVAVSVGDLSSSMTAHQNARIFELYHVISTFLARTMGETIDHAAYDRLVREYNRYFVDGMSTAQKDELRVQMKELREIRTYMDTLAPFGEVRFRFDVSEKHIRLPSESLAPLDMFDSIAVTRYVPYSVFNGDVGRMFKYYNHPDSHPALVPPLSWVHETSSNKTTTQNSIVSKVFSRSQITPENASSKAAYYDIVHQFGSREFVLSYAPRNAAPLSVLYDRIRDAFPTMLFGSEKVRMMSGTFIVRGLLIDKPILADAVFTDPILRKLVSLNESQRPFDLKERTTLHIMVPPFLDVSVTFNSITANQNEVIKSSQDTNVRLEKGERYLRVHLSGLPGEDYVSWTQDIVLRILGLYDSRYSSISSQYASVFPRNTYEAIRDIHDTQSLANVGKPTKLETLQLVDPNLFIPSYASKIQSTSQPTYIEPDRVQYYLNKKVQVVRFPAHIVNSERQINNPSGTYNYYISTAPNKPYLGLIENDLENCVDYPYILASYKEKTLSVNPTTWDIDILIERKGKKKGGAKGYILDVNKVLQPERLGEIKTRIAMLLSEDYKRLGMPASTSSFLHCLFYAIHHRYATEDEITAERMRMSDTVLPEVCKQERYDATTTEITSDIRDVTNYVLDPYSDYRMLEEYYNVTIYTFASHPETGEPVLEVPRNKHFHARRYDISPRKLVFVYKHAINPSKAGCMRSDIPIHCELLIVPPYNSKGVGTTVFSKPALKEKMQNLMRYSSSVTRFAMQEFPSKEVVRTDDVNEVQGTIPPNPVRQTIDANGRTMRLEYADGTVHVLDRAIPPLNIPAEPDVVPPIHTQSPRKVAAVIKSYVQTLFVLSKESKQEFIRRIKVVEGTEYDISDVDRLYPYFGSFRRALKYFSRAFPALFDDEGHIIADSERLAMGISTFVRSLYDMSQHNVVSQFYHEPVDFAMHNRYQVVFMNVADLYRFFGHLHEERRRRAPIDPDHMLHFGTEPYVIRSFGALFMVQPVILGELARALTVVHTWIRYGIDPGFYVHIEEGSTDIEVPVIEDYGAGTVLTTNCVVRFDEQYLAVLAL